MFVPFIALFTVELIVSFTVDIPAAVNIANIKSQDVIVVFESISCKSPTFNCSNAPRGSVAVICTDSQLWAYPWSNCNGSTYPKKHTVSPIVIVTGIERLVDAKSMSVIF